MTMLNAKHLRDLLDKAIAEMGDDVPVYIHLPSGHFAQLPDHPGPCWHLQFDASSVAFRAKHVQWPPEADKQSI